MPPLLNRRVNNGVKLETTPNAISTSRHHPFDVGSHVLVELSLDPEVRKCATDKVCFELRNTGKWILIVDETAAYEATGIPTKKRIYHERNAVFTEATQWMNGYCRNCGNIWMKDEVANEVCQIKKNVVARARREARNRR